MRNTAVCLVPLLACLGAGQNPPPTAPGPPIRVTATEAALDLVVRDKHGRHVKNLKAADVEVYEDGVRQQILSFRQVAGREVERREQTPGAKPAGPTPAAASRTLHAVNSVCIVFHNLDPVARVQATQAVEQFVKNDWPPDTYFAVFNLGDRIVPIHKFTNNRDELLEAARNAFNGHTLDFSRASEALLTANPNMVTITTTVNTATHSASTNVQVSGGEINNSVIMGADVSNSTGANALRGDQVRERGDFSNITGMHETDKIVTMINELGALPGHKTVLLVTTGLVTTGDPERFQAIMANANRRGLTVYALDTTALSAMYDTAQGAKLATARVAGVSATQASKNASLSAMREKSRQGDNMNDAVRNSDTQASLRALAEGTGGTLIANTNDFRKPFQRIVEDLDTHYEVVYRPTSDKYDGHLRKIEVRLARADWQADSRTGYFAMPDLKGSAPLTPEETIALGVLNTQPLPHAFDFRAASYHFRNDGTTIQDALAFELPGASLGALADPLRQSHKFHICLLALVKDSGGQIVDKYSVDSPYEIPDANLPTVRSSALRFTHPVNLAPGRYTVETAVLDREGNQASTNVYRLENPEPPKGVTLSSLLLYHDVEPVRDADGSDPLVFKGKRLIPVVNATLHGGAKHYVYFVVYPDKSVPEKPKVRIEFLSGGQVFAQQTADLPAPDASGTIPMFVAAAMRPGDCELKVTAIQGGESPAETVRYTVAAN